MIRLILLVAVITGSLGVKSQSSWVVESSASLGRFIYGDPARIPWRVADHNLASSVFELTAGWLGETTWIYPAFGLRYVSRVDQNQSLGYLQVPGLIYAEKRLAKFTFGVNAGPDIGILVKNTALNSIRKYDENLSWGLNAGLSVGYMISDSWRILLKGNTRRSLEPDYQFVQGEGPSAKTFEMYAADKWLGIGIVWGI